MSLQTQLNTKISTLAKAEKITKQTLGELSRDMLNYLILEESHDVGMLNRLIGVLSPINKKTAILFFQSHLPYKFDADSGMFGKLNKAKLAGYVDVINNFLADEDNTIWSWGDDLTIAKEKDYAGDIKKAIARGLKGNDKLSYEPISPLDVMKVVLEELSIDDIIDAINKNDSVELTVVEEAA